MMLSILPKFKHEVEHKAELIFVVDRSNSMNGAGIHQAQKALLVNTNIDKFFPFINSILKLTVVSN